MIRLFVPGKLQDGATLALGPDQSHYLRDVMRRSVGDEVVLFNERDGEWRAIVAIIDRRSVSLTPRGRTRGFTAGPDLELIVAVIKRPRLEALVEKATELGVRRIRLALTRFTQGERVKLERLAAIAVEAAEQTGRLDVPEIVGPEKLGDILDGWGERTLVFCDEGGDALPMLQTLSSTGAHSKPLPPRGEGVGDGGASASLGDLPDATNPIVRRDTPTPNPSPQGGGEQAPGTSILIGPEGGFAPEERDRLRALPFVIPVSLGPRILRADTAAIAALVLWQAKLGDWPLEPGGPGAHLV
jgi:16S rRNA (uracil1498-N3)-methyltransferase